MSAVTVRVPRRGTLMARHKPGSLHIDLYFGYAEEPYETLYMADNEGHIPDVRTVVTAWVKEMDSDPAWPTWYEDILAATEQ